MEKETKNKVSKGFFITSGLLFTAAAFLEAYALEETTVQPIRTTIEEAFDQQNRMVFFSESKTQDTGDVDYFELSEELAAAGALGSVLLFGAGLAYRGSYVSQLKREGMLTSHIDTPGGPVPEKPAEREEDGVHWVEGVLVYKSESDVPRPQKETTVVSVREHKH